MYVMNFWEITTTQSKSHDNDVYKTAVNNQIQQLTNQLDKLKLLLNYQVKWSEPQPITSRTSGLSKVIGVYRIIYKPTKETMSIGQGNVGARRSRHLSVFRNNGQDIIHENGCTSP